MDLGSIRNDLRHTMESKGIGLRGLAELTGVSFATLSRVLRGKAPDMRTLAKLEAFISGVPIEESEPIVVRRFRVGGKSFVVEIREVP